MSDDLRLIEQLENETGIKLPRFSLKKTDREAMETLVDFLNDLGIILHFKEYLLEDTRVLRPEWLTGAVYKIVTSKLLSAAPPNGRNKL